MLLDAVSASESGGTLSYTVTAATTTGKTLGQGFLIKFTATIASDQHDFYNDAALTLASNPTGPSTSNRSSEPGPSVWEWGALALSQPQGASCGLPQAERGLGYPAPRAWSVGRRVARWWLRGGLRVDISCISNSHLTVPDCGYVLSPSLCE